MGLLILRFVHALFIRTAYKVYPVVIKLWLRHYKDCYPGGSVVVMTRMLQYTLRLGRIFNFKWGANNSILKSTHYLIAGNIVSIVGSAVKDTTMVQGSVCGPQSQQCVWEIVSLLAVPGASSCQTLHHVTMQS